jgi:hypothetical protein
MANCTVINPTVTLGHIHGTYDCAYFIYLGKAWLMPHDARGVIEPKDGYILVIELEDDELVYLDRKTTVTLATGADIILYRR